MNNIVPQSLHKYGQLKFLTYQCLLIQLLNALLHVGAHFVDSLRKPRDFVFGVLAYPTASIVCYTFWAVWHLVGREYIMPAEMDQFYPPLLNHSTHSIIAPVNIIYLLLVNHKYFKSGTFFNLLYYASYVTLLLYIKNESGLFVYKYLETMNNIERVVYFSCTGLMGYLMYKSGQLLTSVVHKQASQRPPLKKTKQK